MPDPRDDVRSWVEALVPRLTVIWDDAGRASREALGLDPDSWAVADPSLKAAIEGQALAFSRAAADSSRLGAEAARAATRSALLASLLDPEAAPADLLKRLTAIFDDKARAARIAHTEAVRAYHDATYRSGSTSGVVAGWRWLLSEDACHVCRQVAEVGAVRDGQPFAIGASTNPAYAAVKFPPLHPWCACSIAHVLLPSYGGPEAPEWGETDDLGVRDRS